MKLTRLQLSHFMGFQSLDINLDHSMVVLVAENGVGKSSVLKAARVAIGSWLLGIDDPDVKAPSMKAWMIHHRLSQEGYELTKTLTGDARVLATGRIGAIEVSWTRTLKRHKGSRTDRAGANQLRDLARAAEERLPLLAFYSAKSRFPSGHRSPESAAPATRFSAYADCLEGPIDLGERLGRWRRLKLQAADRDDARAVYQALNATLAGLLPGVEKVWFDTDHDAPVVEFKEGVSGGGLRAFHFLSDGFQNILAIGLDLALRAIQLNPALGAEALKETSGVVLIDEMGQHLHPAWQAEVASGLARAFPSVQFLISTHSPMVALGAPSGAQTVLLRAGSEGVVAEEIGRRELGATYDSALRSRAFGLSTTWSREVRVLLEERVELATRSDVEDELRDNARRLDEWLDRPVLPTDTPRRSPVDIQAMRTRMASKLSSDDT